MKCTNCGETLVEGANFCISCGASVKEKAVGEESATGGASGTESRMDVNQNEGQVIEQVTTSGGQPVHIGGQQRYGDEVKGDKIDLGGGTYIRSADTGGGDLVLGNKINGDYTGGDNIEGDKISFGDVLGSQVVIRTGTQVGVDPALLAKLFEEVSQRIDRMPEPAEIGKDELQDTARRVEKEIAKGEQANPERLKRWLDVLEKYAPDVVEILVNVLLNPGAGAASVVKAALKQFGRQP